MIDTDKYEQAYEEWVLMEEPMGSFQAFIFAEYQKAVEEVKRLRKQLAKANKYVYSIIQHNDSMLMDYEDYMKGDEEE